jgi:uncharacterized protein YcgL (UPF0745 family)
MSLSLVTVDANISLADALLLIAASEQADGRRFYCKKSEDVSDVPGLLIEKSTNHHHVRAFTVRRPHPLSETQGD